MNQKTNNVYRILAASTSAESWDDAEKNRANFEKDIVLLAKKLDETVYFQEYKDPTQVAHNSTHILLECSDRFVEEMKKLPAFGSVMLFTPYRAEIPTARRAHPQTPVTFVKKAPQKHP